MSRANAAWIVPFLQDIQDFATEHHLPELSADLAAIIRKHGPLIAPERPGVTDMSTGDLVSLEHLASAARTKGRSH